MGNFKDEDFKVKVPGTDFELQANKTYRVIGKIDTNAPDGYQERGITKYEHPLNGENAIMHFSRERNLWDTGLYENSPCYAKIDTDEINSTVKTLKEKLVPYLKDIFPDNIIDNNKGSNTYWDGYGFPLNQNKTYSTNTPEAFLGIWIGLLHGTLAPEVNVKSPKYRTLNTPFVLVDSGERTSNKQKLDLTKSKATTKFMIALEKDKKFLIDVLNYSEFRATFKTEGTILNSMFQNWINNPKTGSKNSSTFVNAYELFSNEEGKEQLEIYKLLDKGVKNSKVTYSRSEYYIGENSIGNNIKDAAANINKNDKLKAQLIELVG
jgi:hypothetical protein